MGQVTRSMTRSGPDEELAGLMRPDWAGPPPVNVGGVWSFLGHSAPPGDGLALARWIYRHHREIQPMCGAPDVAARLRASPGLMADCPASVEEVTEAAGVAQFGQVLNDLDRIRQHARPAEYPTLKLLRSAMKPAEDATVLDLGCSAGRHLREAQALVPCRLVGLDLDLLAMQLGGLAFAEAGLPAPTWACASITDLPFASGRFSHVITAGTLSLLPVRRGLSEIRRVLRPGGQLILTIEGPGLWRWLYDSAPALSLQRLQLLRWRVGGMLLDVGLDWQANPWTRRLAGLTPMRPGLIGRLVREAGFEVDSCGTLTRYRGLPRVVTVVARKRGGG